jgi:hypothetical protein
MDRTEGFSGNNVTIAAVGGGDNISIAIQRNEVDEDYAIVSVNVNGRQESSSVLKQILYDVLARTNQLDEKLEMKLDMLFKRQNLVSKDGHFVVDFPFFGASATYAVFDMTHKDSPPQQCLDTELAFSAREVTVKDLAGEVSRPWTHTKTEGTKYFFKDKQGIEWIISSQNVTYIAPHRILMFVTKQRLF